MAQKPPEKKKRNTCAQSRRQMQSIFGDEVAEVDKVVAERSEEKEMKE